MATLRIEVVSPLVTFLDENLTSDALAPRPASLDGKVLGLLPNWRPAASDILQLLATMLKERYRLKDVVMEAPARQGVLPGAQQLADFAQRMDVVILGSGDCGGCTTWCSQVAPALEKRGVPAVAVVSDAFAKFARRMASVQGCPYVVIAEVEEPIISLSAEELQRRAQAMIESVVDGLTLQPAEIERRFKTAVGQQLRPRGAVRSSVPI